MLRSRSISPNTSQQEPTMKAAELFVKCLENESVEYIFGIPGGALVQSLASGRLPTFVM
jgi:hypothetical protein